MRNRLVKISIIISVVFLLNSCATMFFGTSQKVNITSTPAGADVYINGVAANKQTPCEVSIKRKAKPTEHNGKNQYNYVLKKNGYQDFLVTDNAKFNYVSLLNIYWLGLPYILDGPDGAIWKYEKKQNVNLVVAAKNTPNNNAKSQITENVSTGTTSANKKAQSNTTRSRTSENESSNTTTTNAAVKNQKISNVGKFYALIIGNNDYLDPEIPSLDEPASDATKLFNVLTTRYTFEKSNVTFLKNATYVQMIQAFDDLSNKITKNDNLLVFYAGHGWWNELKSLGFWLPIDAKKTNTAYWIPNSRISDYMSSIKSKHTLLIADACFSGSIFKTRGLIDAKPSINKLYDLPSKKAMTSGTLKEVPDKSVFLQYLVQRLNENTEKYISSDILFSSFREAVLNNSPTEPQYGTIQNAGDEGGEFIFILR
ncbi:MAG TPA: caspase family protein [Bacteroidales bacterium]